MMKSTWRSRNSGLTARPPNQSIEPTRGSRFCHTAFFSQWRLPVAATLAIISAGAGHVDYFMAKVLFPFTMLSTFVLGSITVPFVLGATAEAAR